MIYGRLSWMGIYILNPEEDHWLCQSYNGLFSSSCETEYTTTVSRSTSAQVTRKLLQVTDEGTSQVMDSTISLLTSQYEAYKMEDSKSIKVLYNQFNNVAVAL